MVGDNALPPEWWQSQPGKHCGQICLDFSCPVCGEKVPVIPDNVTLSDN